MTIINKILNDESNSYIARKVKLLAIDDISINPLNKAPITNIDELSKTISEVGLKSPILVYKRDNSDYVIVNGERRYTAIKQLGWDRIPAIICEKPSSIIEEKLLILDTNAQRDISNKYKKIRAKEYEEIYLELSKSNNHIGNKRDWIGDHMNLSGRQVSRLLNDSDSKVANNSTNGLDNNVFKECSDDLSTYLGTKVQFNKNKFSISFNNIDDLKDILSKLNLHNCAEKLNF